MEPDGPENGGEQLTERQRKWFVSVRGNLAAKTGKSQQDWAESARSCPHEKPRARTDWLRGHYGLGVNHAAFILGEAFPSKERGWSEAPALRAALWKEPAALAILEAIEAAVVELPEMVRGQREGFTAFSRKVQFAAARPLKGGAVALGLGVSPELGARLSLARNEGWSERLKAVVRLERPEAVDAEIRSLRKAAWERA